MSLLDLNILHFDTQQELVEMSKYGSLNLDANLMNFYASKVESSYLHAKKEMARLTVTFKQAYENRSLVTLRLKLDLAGIVTTLILSEIQ